MFLPDYVVQKLSNLQGLLCGSAVGGLPGHGRRVGQGGPRALLGERDRLQRFWVEALEEPIGDKQFDHLWSYFIHFVQMIFKNLNNQWGFRI